LEIARCSHGFSRNFGVASSRTHATLLPPKSSDFHEFEASSGLGVDSSIVKWRIPNPNLHVLPEKLHYATFGLLHEILHGYQKYL
jgi:hypothetical protein